MSSRLANASAVELVVSSTKLYKPGAVTRDGASIVFHVPAATVPDAPSFVTEIVLEGWLAYARLLSVQVESLTP